MSSRGASTSSRIQKGEGLAIKTANNNEKNNGESDFKGLSFAYRISTELAAALIVSVLIGLGIDKFFDTKPFGLITLIILGFLAGLLNIYRLIRRIENSK